MRFFGRTLWMTLLAAGFIAVGPVASSDAHAATKSSRSAGNSAESGADAHDDGESESPAAESGSVQTSSPAKSTASKRVSSRSRKVASRSRRSAKPKGRVVPESQLRAEPPPRPSGNLYIRSVASHDEVKVNIYNDDGSYNLEAVRAVSHVLRCKRTDTEKEIEPRLLTYLSHVYDKYNKPLEVISGFRNQRRTSSYHYKGSASDIRVSGVKPKDLRAFVESLDSGGMGIGIYPRTGFIHVDVRPPPSYRWVDYSRSGSNAADKRPPRGFKRKPKLQS